MCFCVLCSYLTFDISVSYGQSFVLQPDSITTNNNYRNNSRSRQKQRPAYTGGVVSVPQTDNGGYQRYRAFEAAQNDDGNQTISYGARPKKKDDVKKRVRSSRSNKTKNISARAKDAEDLAEYDRRAAHRKRIQAKSKAAYDKKMAPFLAKQRAEQQKAERARRSKAIRANRYAKNKKRR